MKGVTESGMKPGRVYPGVGVGSIVMKNGSLLMVRRDGAHGAGLWSVPGGWVKLWEYPWLTAEREVAEETGLSVRAVGDLGWSDSQFRPEGVHAVTLWVECKYLGGIPKVLEPEKCPEVAWVEFPAVTARPLFTPFDRWWPRYLASTGRLPGGG